MIFGLFFLKIYSLQVLIFETCNGCGEIGVQRGNFIFEKRFQLVSDDKLLKVITIFVLHFLVEVSAAQVAHKKSNYNPNCSHTGSAVITPKQIYSATRQIAQFKIIPCPVILPFLNHFVTSISNRTHSPAFLNSIFISSNLNAALQLDSRNQMKTKFVKELSLAQQKLRCKEFVQNFQDYSHPEELEEAYEKWGNKKYMIKLQQVANKQIKIIEVFVEDLVDFFRKEEEKTLLNKLKKNTISYLELFTEVCDELMVPRNIQINPEDEAKEELQNILEKQRKQNMEGLTQSTKDSYERLPSQLHRKFQVQIVYHDVTKITLRSISSLQSDEIGSLIALKAIVVRAGEIKPGMIIATYACDICGCENYKEVMNSEYKPMLVCNSSKCRENGVNGKLTFLPGHSTFKAHQQLKIQETPDQLSQGSIPRSLKLSIKGENIKQACPGDVIIVQGILLVEKKSTFLHQGDLCFDLFLETTQIIREKKKYVELNISKESQEEIYKMRGKLEEQEIFNKLANSIAPEIYGMEDVKKSLLLLMAGGVTRETHDNMRIRGEINIALIGDPGIAKSQLLKHVSYMAPRGIYTTGKGSSGVGLTAAIVTDMDTKQLALEAGALVLADMGVCCIDQFDKMDQYDRTAIHEVMEQQTVSIAKAGITTTLNARTSILAAANPLFGRYNLKETAHKNINLPAALLSRFDLIFILLDSKDQGRDLELSKHIGMVHKNKKSPFEAIFDSEFLRNYIAMAKAYEPTISEEIKVELIDRYIKKRQSSANTIKEGESYITMRSLLAMVRLCQARAKLRFSNQVSREDLLEIEEIILESQKNISGDSEARKPRIDNVTEIYKMIKDICEYKMDGEADLEDIQKRVLSRGFSQNELEVTLEQYELMNVLLRTEGKVQMVK